MEKSLAVEGVLLSWRSAEVDQAYEREIRSTEAGRSSAQLRRRAVALAAIHRIEDAHELLVEAVQLHLEADTSAAAGSARHDLAHSFSCRRLGAPVENLLAAERWYRAAIACPSRANHPYRAVQTLSSLGICLRHLAARCGDKEKAEQYLIEAEQTLRRAISTTDSIGPSGWTLAAAQTLNLGNLLLDQRADVDAALACYRRALELHGQTLAVLPSAHVRADHDLAALAVAQAYVRRGRKGDVSKAIELLSKVLKEGDPRNLDVVRLAMATAWMSGKDRQREKKALEYLETISVSSLAPHKLQHVAELFRRVGRAEYALALLEHLVQSAIQQRSQAMADHIADEAVARANAAAAAAARLYVEQSNPLGAFLVLENSSALRFDEATSNYTWFPSDPVALELLRELRQRQSSAAMLDELASRLEYMLEEERSGVLLDICAQGLPRSRVDPDEDKVSSLLRGCAAEEDPVAGLRREAKAILPMVERLLAILMARYPESVAALSPNSSVVDRTTIEALLRELPGHVFLRFSLAKDLLLVAVWMEGSKLRSASLRQPFPRELWGLLKRSMSQEEWGAHHGALTAMFERLDLSKALPNSRREHAVILPSSQASFLPLAALGPPGSRLIDRFDSIIWLPSLYPLRTRQAAHPPRSQALIVIPPGTKLSKLAFDRFSSSESWLDGDDATLSNVLERASEADTVCFYTHGQHVGGESPSIKLADEILDVRHLWGRWHGVERVELWACETGVSQPSDPLTPFGVDEAHGLDFEFLRFGARSAIGTLWEVPELVTAILIRRYREEIAWGCDPARALAEAQRWWLAEKLPALLALFDGRPANRALWDFATTLGTDESLSAKATGEATMSDQEIRKLREQYSCPVSWAGYRFVGVPDRRPVEAWTEAHARPADEEVKREVDRLIESAAETAEPIEEWRERELQALMSDVPGSPTAEQAIHAARLLRDRIASRHDYNLLAGLAWLHEALVCKPLTGAVRTSLSIEAAHLWLDLAAGEAFHPLLSGPRLGASVRARALLQDCDGDDPELVLARARLVHWDALRSKSGLHGAARLGWQELGGELDPPEATYESIRCAVTVCEWLIVDPDPRAVATVSARVLEHVRGLVQLLQQTPWQGVLIGASARLSEVHDALTCQLEAQRPRLGHWRALTPRELARSTQRNVGWLAHQGPPAMPEALAITSESLGQMEGALWGWPGDNTALVSSSGTAGRAYRELLGDYLASKARRPGDVVHVIACLQYACDLRLTLRHHLARLISSQPELRRVLDSPLWQALNDRDGLWTNLADAAEVFDLEEPGNQLPIDPFVSSAQALSSAGHVTSWILGQRCEWRGELDPERRTAAYQAVRMAEQRTQSLEASWQKIREAEARAEGMMYRDPALVTKLLDPGIVLESNHELLQQLPQGRGILALSLDARGGLVGASLWRDERGVGQKLLHVPASDPDLRGLVFDLLRPGELDHLPVQGRCPARKVAWDRVDRWLAPQLAKLLGDGLTHRLHWMVLAPGALRALPLLGLHAGKKDIASSVQSLVHLPSLGFAFRHPPVSKAGRTACLLAETREDGDTTFGEATITTLRRAFPPDVIVDPSELKGLTIVEVDTLEAIHEELDSLRMYGVGSPHSQNRSTAALRLRDRRALGSHNLANLRLGACRAVEIWSCVTGGAEALSLLRDDADHLPGLVSDFLSAGAHGVLDLAWPVPDLVKAVVCELFTVVSPGQPSANALRYAVCAAATLFEEWGNQAKNAASIFESLKILDEGRRFAFSEVHRVDPSCIVPFAGCSDAPALAGLTARALIEEVSHPSHLAAFRWWGF